MERFAQIPVPVEVIKEVPVPVERVMYKEVLVPVEHGSMEARGSVMAETIRPSTHMTQEHVRSAQVIRVHSVRVQLVIYLDLVTDSN